MTRSIRPSANFEVTALPRHRVRIQQRVDRITRATPRLVEIHVAALAGQAGRTVVDEAQQRARAIVHGDDPVGEFEDGAGRLRVARQVEILQQARGVVVFVARAAAVRPVRVLLAVGAMRAGRRGLIVVGVPEEPAAETRLVVARVVDVDVDEVARRVDHEFAPALLARAQEVHARAVHEVVLVVVVRDERARALVMHRFVVGVQVAEIAPAVFVDDLALREHRILPLDHRTHVPQVGLVVVDGRQ